MRSPREMFLRVWLFACHHATPEPGGGPQGSCGDGVCAGSEDCASCAVDCGPCPPSGCNPLPPPPQSGTTYYVAPPPAGDDTHPGSLSQPFATLQHAADTVHAVAPVML